MLCDGYKYIQEPRGIAILCCIAEMQPAEPISIALRVPAAFSVVQKPVTKAIAVS